MIRSVALPVLVIALIAGAQAFAQTANNVSAGASGSGSAGSGTAVPGIIVSPPITPVPPVPAPTPNPSPDTGFVQFNNLTIINISDTNVPAEIVATMQEPIPVPLSANGSGTSGTGNCMRFNSESAATGMAIPCPMPPTSPDNSSSGPAPTNSASAPSGAVSPGPAVNMPNIALPPPRAYRIEVDANTEIMLRDRTAAQLADLSSGDEINVYGYYNIDGSIQAFIVRDLSKPIVTTSMQLNNVTLVSVSASTTPTTLAVTQTVMAPCFGFGANGAARSIACPMGVPSFSANSATANVTPPQALMPNWAMLRKYVVNVDSRTIILDRNRTELPLGSLTPGDSLNIYGETSDNGQTLTADIVRDLSVPAAATTITGTVSQVNADGSFVIQTTDGRTITVQNPISVGEAVTLQGIINSAENVISQISQILIRQ